MSPSPDPFQSARQTSGTLQTTFGDEPITMILRHDAVREAAKDWQTYSSNHPFRVPIPSEENLRTMRQLPIETDPPDHKIFRDVIEPFFRRPKDPHVITSTEALIDRMLTEALTKNSVEIVRDFALPLQSRALTLLLNVPESEAETWIAWGIHVFHDTSTGSSKGQTLETYLQNRFDQAEANPGDDFFTALTRATVHDRPLTRQEMMGYANLAFAGGRDTIIHTISSIIAHLANHPEHLTFLREDPKRIVNATEEFFRVISPLTHIGRVCPVDTNVHGTQVKANQRISLCWASANRDENAFPAPLETRLDRKPNPHVAFGAGPHLCIGAPHARLLARTLLRALSERVAKITLIEATPHLESESTYQRNVGYDSLTVRLSPS